MYGWIGYPSEPTYEMLDPSILMQIHTSDQNKGTNIKNNVTDYYKANKVLSPHPKNVAYVMIYVVSDLLLRILVKY